MKKLRTYWIVAFVFLLLQSTYPLWMGKLGMGAMLAFAVLFIIFIILGVWLIYHAVTLISDRFRDKGRLAFVLFLVFVLGLAVYNPMGFINHKLLYGEDIFFAYSEGGGNCSTALKLYDNNKFYYQEVCFGVTAITGEYKLVEDTIFLEVSSGQTFFKYGIIDPNPSVMDYSNPEKGSLKLYRNLGDSIPKADLDILKNTLSTE